MKKLLGIAIILVIGFFALNKLGLVKLPSAEEKTNKAKNPPAIESFEEIDLDFTHVAAEGRFPFLGGTSADLDGDGKDEIVIAGSKGQKSKIFSYRGEKLVDLSEEFNFNTTDEAVFGISSFDIDNDNDVDLVLAQHDGVYLLINENGKFSEAQKIAFNAPVDSFPFNVAIADINNDNLADLYVSNFVAPSKFVTATFNDPVHAKANNMLLNKGDGSFEDVTAQTGTTGIQNTFHSSFVDLNDDGKQDLVLANNTGEVEIFKNLGGMRFENIHLRTGLGFWMGLGVGDIDKDGDQDLFFSNIGSSIPAKLVRGDMTDEQVGELEWLVLRNDGDFDFKNITKDYQLDGYGFAWGGVFEDINLDGELDLLVAQNYIKWPGHKVKKLPGKAFLQLEQDSKNGFFHLDELGLNNEHFGQSPLISDINSDGKPDVLWLNMNGPARAFINQSKNNFLTIKVPDNNDYLGAKFTLEFEDGTKSYTKYLAQNIGMSTDQSTDIFFGLEDKVKIKSLVIEKRDGSKQLVENPQVNTVISLLTN